MNKRVLLVLCFTILAILSGRGQAASVSTAPQTTSDENSVYLPIVYRGPEHQSPFWVQIAAIHEIVPSRMLAEPAMSDAERMAYLEEVFPTLIDALNELNVGGTRVYLEWSDIEPDAPILGEPQYDPTYWDWYDDRFAEIGEAGIKMIVTVADFPDWAADERCGPIDLTRLDEYARFLTDLVNRYKLPPYNVKHWELVNEPDYVLEGDPGGGIGCWGNDGDRYALALAVAYPAIKAADPDVVVLQGGIAYDWFFGEENLPEDPPNPFNRYFSDDVMRAGGGANFDVLNFHYFPDYHLEWERWDPESIDRQNGWLNAPTCGDYFDGWGREYEAGGIDLIAKTSHYRNRMDTCFDLDKPVWVTELAEHGYEDDPASQIQQARYAIQGNVRGLAAGVEKIVWFALVTPDNDFDQGLLNDDFSPKPAFYAFKTLNAELAGYDYVQTLEVENVEAYVFQSASGQDKVVAWGDNSLLFNPASQLRVVDRDGNETWVLDGGPGDMDGIQNSVISFQVLSEPVFIQPLFP